ncbi:hypothetical protein IEO21_08019 [Rhodonia placenta]|uniref:Protein kinase domain-containing protein n=1 Tax=Rhodonia placenta TaxID=104341 RepID=A0A8H7NX03_9APHY|nr:hypothetical protein IEO21_08019 [Postia placenta]
MERNKDWSTVDNAASLIRMSPSETIPTQAIGTNAWTVEDHVQTNVKHNVIDAIRLSDGLGVSVKTTPNDSQEIAIATFVSSLDLLDDPSNHCVKLLEVLPDPLHADRSLMIMPYLRPFDDPEFGAIGEVVDFVKQTLEGICFLHKHRIAHRIDHPVRYHLIDFGISTRFPVGSSTYVTGLKGRDKDVPELSADVPYDAMKVDIFTLGNLYHKEFVQKYHGLDFLQPLIGAMTQRQPERRPAAEVALAIFEDISSRLNSSLLRWRLRSRAESQPERVLYDTVAVAREGIYHLKRLVT